MSASKPLEEGDIVRSPLYFSDPVEGVVVAPEDRFGWIEVEEDFIGGKNRFVAIADRCERI